MAKPYAWNPEKNAQIQEERGISFEEIVAALEDDKLLERTPHHNPKLAHQDILFVALKGDVVAVPCVENEEHIFLKTAFVSRKARAKYLSNQQDHD